MPSARPAGHVADWTLTMPSANAHAIVDLTTTGAPGFKENDPVPGIRYFAYAGAGIGSALLFPTHVLMQSHYGDYC